jgi:hypothetical protein
LGATRRGSDTTTSNANGSSDGSNGGSVSHGDGGNSTELRMHTLEELMELACAGMNLYKLVEMWKNYCPHVDPIYWDNDLYCKPDDKV